MDIDVEPFFTNTGFDVFSHMVGGDRVGFWIFQLIVSLAVLTALHWAITFVSKLFWALVEVMTAARRVG